MSKLNRLKLVNFRCFQNYDITFSDKINLLVGNNAVGKTSIVEAIYCLGLTKSHRASNDLSLIKDGEEYTIIKGFFERKTVESEVSLSITEKGKKVIINNKVYGSLSDYLGFLNVVMFCPEDMELVKGGPATRRKFLDSNISQINQRYLKNSINYRKLLKERNEILKSINEGRSNDYNLLDVYTQELAKEAEIIVKTRKQFIDELNPHILSNTKVISEQFESSKIKYLPSIEYDFLKTYKENLKNDLNLKTTTKGPHRDDFVIQLNKKSVLKQDIAMQDIAMQDIAIYGSQGQQRTAVLSVKLALAKLIHMQKDNLIIILDDVFSELDQARQNEIISLLSESNQIFITTTSIDNLTKRVLKDSLVINIYKESEENGQSR